MRIPVLIAFLTTLLTVEHVHGQAACIEELTRELNKVWDTWEVCAAEGQPCLPQCTFEREGATAGGTLTGASFSAEIHRRMSATTCAALDANMAQCLSLVGGSVGPASPCENWEAVGNCIVDSLSTVCAPAYRRYWGGYGRK